MILTTAANASMEKVHDRMPLILEEKKWKTGFIIPRFGRRPFIKFRRFYSNISHMYSRAYFNAARGVKAPSAKVLHIALCLNRISMKVGLIYKYSLLKSELMFVKIRDIRRGCI